MCDRAVNGFEFRVTGDALGDRVAGEVAAHEKRGRRAEGCANGNRDTAFHQAEQNARTEREQDARYEQHRGHDIQDDESDRSPHAQAFDPCQTLTDPLCNG